MFQDILDYLLSLLICKYDMKFYMKWKCTLTENDSFHHLYFHFLLVIYVYLYIYDNLQVIER